MKGSSNFGDTTSLGEHTLGSHIFLSKAENHCVIVLILKKALGWGRAINHSTCKSVTEDYGIETYMAKAYGLSDIETAICPGLYVHIITWEKNVIVSR